MSVRAETVDDMEMWETTKKPWDDFGQQDVQQLPARWQPGLCQESARIAEYKSLKERLQKELTKREA